MGDPGCSGEALRRSTSGESHTLDALLRAKIIVEKHGNTADEAQCFTRFAAKVLALNSTALT